MLSDFELSYAFMMEEGGFVVWHPALPSAEARLKNVRVLELEPDVGFKENVYPQLLSRSSHLTSLHLKSPHRTSPHLTSYLTSHLTPPT